MSLHNGMAEVGGRQIVLVLPGFGGGGGEGEYSGINTKFQTWHGFSKLPKAYEYAHSSLAEIGFLIVLIDKMLTFRTI